MRPEEEIVTEIYGPNREYNFIVEVSRTYCNVDCVHYKDKSDEQV